MARVAVGIMFFACLACAWFDYIIEKRKRREIKNMISQDFQVSVLL
jgi:hypothetical protein